jgi:NAD(P)-dependent dehydrogenase (short-subunit alcohol dehydrogenase family)
VDGEVSKKETAVRVVDSALKHCGRIDLLVNNAGIFIPKPFTEYTEDDYNRVMNTNVASYFFMTQQVIPQMKKQKAGHVVNISAVLADPSIVTDLLVSETERQRACCSGRAFEIADARRK